jgi:hypothetical protein
LTTVLKDVAAQPTVCDDDDDSADEDWDDDVSHTSDASADDDLDETFDDGDAPLAEPIRFAAAEAAAAYDEPQTNEHTTRQSMGATTASRPRAARGHLPD